MTSPASPSAPLASGPVGRHLVRLTVPMMAGILSIMIFHLVDNFFLGRYSVEALTAITFAFPIVTTLGSLALGLGVGVSVVVANAIGQGDRHQVQRLTTDSLLLSVLIVTACGAAGLLTMDPLFAVLGADPEVAQLVRQYMQIWYWSVGLVVIPMTGNAAIRATGDTRTPSLIMVIAAVTNVVLDPLLIFGWGPVPELGVQGAALATAIARAVTLVASLYVLGWRDRMISLRGMNPTAVLASWRRILHVGLPAAATRMLAPVSMGVLTGLVARHGAAGVAAYGIGSRVGMFVFSVIMAQSTALAPFIGQNLGAGRSDRIRRAAWLSVAFGVGYGFLLWAVMALAARPVALVFNRDPDVVAAAVSYFRIVPIGAAFSAFVALACSALNAMLKPIWSACLTALQTFVLALPLAWLGSHLLGLEGIFWGSATANILAGGVAAWTLRRLLRSLP